MGSDNSGRRPGELERETAAKRVQRTEIAALHAAAETVRRRAEALRLLPKSAVAATDHAEPIATATSQDLARHAERLGAALAAATQSLEAEISDAFAKRIQQEEALPGREIALARRALADNLTRCDPADFGYLERLALNLAETGSKGARELRGRLAESVDRGQRAVQASMSRARIQVLLTDVLPDERELLTALLASTADQDLPALMNQVHAAVTRADQHRFRTDAAKQ